MMFSHTPTVPTEQPVPRWADRAARAIPWLILPQCLWRLPFAFGFTMGTRQSGTVHWWAVPYVFGLSVLSESLGLLGLALVSGWGETVPARVPVIGGKRVRPFAAMAPALALGGVLTAVTADWVLAVTGVVPEVEFTGTAWRALGTVTSGLMVLWGPLLLAVTYAYYRRRCKPQAVSASSDATPAGNA